MFTINNDRASMVSYWQDLILTAAQYEWLIKPEIDGNPLSISPIKVDIVRYILSEIYAGEDYFEGSPYPNFDPHWKSVLDWMAKNKSFRILRLAIFENNSEIDYTYGIDNNRLGDYKLRYLFLQNGCHVINNNLEIEFIKLR